MESIPSNLKEENVALTQKSPEYPIIITQFQEITSNIIPEPINPLDPSPKNIPVIPENIEQHIVPNISTPKSETAKNIVIVEDRRESAGRRSYFPGRKNTNKVSPTKSPEKEVDVFKVVEEKKSNKVIKLENFIECTPFQILISLFTVYALFGADLKFLISEKKDDGIFDYFTIFSLFIFCFEIIVSVIVKKDYLFSFFFFLDAISTVTLIFDLTYVDSAFFGSASNTTQLTRASRATKIGSRAGRVVRLIRLIRMVKIWKSYKTSLEKKEERQKRAKKLKEEAENSPKQNIIVPFNDNEINDKSSNKDSDQMSINNNSPLYLPQGSLLPLSGRPTVSYQPIHPSPFNLKVYPAPLEVNSAAITNSLTPNMNLNADTPVHKFSKARSSTINKTQIIADPLEEIELNPEYFEDSQKKESRVGKKLSELTTKRVVILVLLLIFIVPLFSSSYYFEPDKGYTLGIKILANMVIERRSNSEIYRALQDYISQNSEHHPLVYVTLSNYPSFNYKSMDPEDLRTDEKDITLVITDNSLEFMAVIDLRYNSKSNAIINITRTIFVSMVLSIGAMFFSKDANKLILRPLERMIEKVNRIAANPLASRDETIINEKGSMQFETVLIENAIIKIGALLALGFGDAGSEIIASNMSKGGDLDPMMAGKRRCAVFGFCDIRSFTDTTEVLQEEVMMFVNSIARIVHTLVDRYAGSANKNIGDAFLLVYKFPEDEVLTLPHGIMDLKRDRITKNIADLSLISFIKIIAGINKKPSVIKYRNNEKLCARMPNYKVKMGFGLHFGWAIEGAIGSEFKIDASYLSPNVNMASRLEAATKQYGVPLLISNELYRILSKKMQRFCREIDRVTVKGSKKPIGLFTVDVDISVLTTSPLKDYSNLEIAEKNKEKKYMLLDAFLYSAEPIRTNSLLESDKDLIKMTENSFGPFRNLFSEAFEEYIKGDWLTCKTKLDQCLNEKNEDGPSLTLMDVIKEGGFKSPDDWKGFRVLTEK